MVGLDSSMYRIRTLAQDSTVFTICPQLYGCKGAQRDLILKIILLFFVCMYSLDFIPTLDGSILPALIIDPRSFFLVYGWDWGVGGVGGKYSMGLFHWSTRMLATNLCVMCFICYDQSMYVLIFLSRCRQGNTSDGRGWVSVVSSLSMAGDITGKESKLYECQFRIRMGCIMENFGYSEKRTRT